jgi:aspartate racemase
MIGLIGGMSWESTAVYYRRINEQVRVRLGGLHSADVVMRSVDFAGIVGLQQTDAWTRPAPSSPASDATCRTPAPSAC